MNPFEPNANERKQAKTGALFQAGALVTAILASACCWLPLLLIALGVSGGALSAGFVRLRPILLPLTFALLGLAFYFAYRRPRAPRPARSPAHGTCHAPIEAAMDEAACCPPPGTRGFTVKKLNRVLLWVITALVLAFAFFPNYAGSLLGGKEPVPAPRPADATAVTWTLEIEGMSCEACAALIASRLRAVPGVREARVDFDAKKASVRASPRVDPSELQAAVRAAGYEVEALSPVPPEKEPTP